MEAERGDMLSLGAPAEGLVSQARESWRGSWREEYLENGVPQAMMERPQGRPVWKRS